MDVKKAGRIPDGGGWKAHGRRMGSTGAQKRARIGYDYVHSLVDDHSRLAYSEILPDEKGPTCGGFLRRAAAYFAQHGIPTIERVITDNRWSYRRGTDIAAVIAELGAKHQSIRPHCPWQNGKVERGKDGKVQPHPAGRVGLPPGLPQQRRPVAALAPGSSTTTFNAATPHSVDSRLSADCHHPMSEYN